MKTKAGTEIATGFIRVVHGGRGDYVEFSKEQMILKNTKIPDNQAWRVTATKRFYIEYRTVPDNVKIYFQTAHVGYADYKPGYFYIAVPDLDFMFKNTATKLEEFLDERAR